MKFQDASAWITSHPFDNPARFKGQAVRLGPDAIPGMIEVLAKGPMSQHTAAALVLSLSGIKVVGHGDTPDDYEYRLTMPDGERKVVHCVNLGASDFLEGPPGEMEPWLDEKSLRRMFMQYLILFALAGALAYLATQTSGAISIVLAVTAALLSAVAVWSTLFMSVIRGVLHRIERLNEG